MNEIAVVPVEERAFYTPLGLAKRLAISERTVRQMLADGVIPSYRVERTRRIDPADVDMYLAARCDAGRDELRD